MLQGLLRTTLSGTVVGIASSLVLALAAFVDYVVVPKRLTPGWEKVVSPRSIALAYGAMAVALWATSSPGKGR